MPERSWEINMKNMTKNMKKNGSIVLAWIMMLSLSAPMVHVIAQEYTGCGEDGMQVCDPTTDPNATTPPDTTSQGNLENGTSNSCDFSGGCAQYDPNAPQLPAGFDYSLGLSSTGGPIATSGSQGSYRILLYRSDGAGGFTPFPSSRGGIGSGQGYYISPDGSGANPAVYSDGTIKLFASGQPMTLYSGQLLRVTNSSTGAHEPASLGVPTSFNGNTLFQQPSNTVPGAPAGTGNTGTGGNTTNAGNTTSNGQNPTTSTCTNCGAGSSNTAASNPSAANQLGVAGPSGALGAGTGGANSSTGAGTGGSNSFSSGGAGSGSGAINNPLGSSATNLTQLILRVTDAATSFLLIISVIFFLWTGLQFLLAQGNETKIQDAKRAFWNTVIGTGVVLAAKLIVQIISNTISKIDPSIHSSF